MQSLPFGWVTLGRVASHAEAATSVDDLIAQLSAGVPEGMRVMAPAHARGTRMLVLVLPDSRFVGGIAGLGDAYPAGITTVAAIENEGYSVVLGSGFVSQYTPLQALGMLRIAGADITPLEPHGYTRILGVVQGSGRLAVLPRSQPGAVPLRDALQLGPGIIEAGELDISDRDLQKVPYFRAFIGLCEDFTLVGITLTPMHLYHVGLDLLNLADRESWQCSEVVNLSGDREAVLAVGSASDGRLAHFGHVFTAKAAVVGFRTQVADGPSRRAVQGIE